MRRIRALLFVMIIGLPGYSGAVTVPTNLTVTGATDSITVNWTANLYDTVGYYVYWGTSSSNLENRKTVYGISSTSTIINDLTPDTTYYVAISAYSTDIMGISVESQRSLAVSVITETDDSDDSLEIPQEFAVSSPDAITKSSATFVWEAVSDENITAYRIYYGTTPGYYDQDTDDIQINATAFTVSGLEIETRYYFVIRSVDENGTESGNSDELIVDTLFDGLPPNSPNDVEIEISGDREVRISFDGNNAGMADLAGYVLYHGQSGEMTAPPIEIGLDTAYALGDLIEGETYYFAVSAHDRNGNDSDLSETASITIEKFQPLLIDNDSFKAGCFVGSGIESRAVFKGMPFAAFILILGIFIRNGWLRWPGGIVVIALLCLVPGTLRADESSFSNSVGIKIGYYAPAEDRHMDIYKDDAIPVSLFYDRRIVSNLHLDIEAGFIKQEGYLRTVSGTRTDIATQLLLVPVSSTLKWHFYFTDLIYAYIGAGPDLWYFREESGRKILDAFDEDEYGVGGYHGKIGMVYLTSEEEFFERCGVLIEGTFNKIDRFDHNRTDIGGWIVQVGYLYRF